MTKEEHLQWAKDRANEYCDADKVSSAITSFISDLGKHEELKDHVVITLIGGMLIRGKLNTASEVKEFINGTH